MATKATINRRVSWKRAYRKYTDLNQRIEQAQFHELDALGRALATQTDRLLELPAPSFAAVLQKLGILWEADIEKPNQDAEEKRLILEDMQDLITESAQLLGIEQDPRPFA